MPLTCSVDQSRAWFGADLSVVLPLGPAGYALEWTGGVRASARGVVHQRSTPKAALDQRLGAIVQATFALTQATDAADLVLDILVQLRAIPSAAT